MSQAAEAGAVIFPPVPAFYNHPTTTDEIINQTVGRVLMRLGIFTDLYTQWQGPQAGE
jgi:3-polyprenyl-4-hydroxybenzoate decarboxylase